jgi:hypothetical protein
MATLQVPSKDDPLALRRAASDGTLVMSISKPAIITAKIDRHPVVIRFAPTLLVMIMFGPQRL